jgi:N-acetylated-alpha-linked acidic dipeptidase
VTTPIWNVIGVIKGSISDEVIVIGNHRDAWIAGGAGDPNSGSAVINEVIRSLGKAVEAGKSFFDLILRAFSNADTPSRLGTAENPRLRQLGRRRVW